MAIEKKLKKLDKGTPKQELKAAKPGKKDLSFEKSAKMKVKSKPMKKDCK